MTDIGECMKTISTQEGEIGIYSLKELEAKGIIKDLSKMPYSIKVLVESMLRQRDGNIITDEDVLLLQKNKWVLAHPEREPLMKQGAHPGLIGENKELKYER